MAYRCQASSVGVRLKSLILATSLCLTLLFGGVANAGTRQQSGPCDGASSHIRPSMGYTEVSKRVHQLIRCASNRYGISTARMTCTADRESSFWPYADSGSSKGVMQQNATYWPGRVHAFWVRSWMPRHYPPSIFNARANIIVSAKMIRAGGWSPWSGGCV